MSTPVLSSSPRYLNLILSQIGVKWPSVSAWYGVSSAQRKNVSRLIRFMKPADNGLIAAVTGNLIGWFRWFFSFPNSSIFAGFINITRKYNKLEVLQLHSRGVQPAEKKGLLLLLQNCFIACRLWRQDSSKNMMVVGSRCCWCCRAHLSYHHTYADDTSAINKSTAITKILRLYSLVELFVERRNQTWRAENVIHFSRLRNFIK